MVTGSEKQMKWYEEILKEAYDYLDAMTTADCFHPNSLTAIFAW